MPKGKSAPGNVSIGPPAGVPDVPTNVSTSDVGPATAKRFASAQKKTCVVARKVCDCTRHACNSIQGARRELPLRAGMRQEPQRGFVELAIAAHRIPGNLRVAGQRG